MNFEPLIKARKILDEVWKKSLLRGRCWGPKRKDNPFSASNITMATGEELVSISSKDDGTLIIHEFRRAERTSLGCQIREMLKKDGISIE